eukprot:scaffold2519_cov168-Amphora_coffeaeformis.AAC.15
MGDQASCSDIFPWREEGFARAVLASSIPFEEDRPEKEGRYLREALVGLHNMFGYMAPTSKTSLPDPVKQAIIRLVQRVDNVAFSVSLPEAAEIRWACLGIFARSNVLDDSRGENDEVISRLNERVAALPFDLVSQVIDWNQFFPDQLATHCLQEEIPFHFDTIVTRTGAAVTERRGTAWIAEDGIGALAYSGKLMPPHKISDHIRSIMRSVEDRVIDSREFSRPFFDCGLCNHYPDGESACKFVSVSRKNFFRLPCINPTTHTDPEHGSKWERLNCVIAAGSPRRFAFRPIPGHATWSEWDSSSATGAVTTASDPNVPAVITLFPGDVAKMWGTCNDDFHHAVYPGQARPGEREVERISLVLKRAIPNSSGLRGHRLSGEGRRSRRKVKSEDPPPSLPRNGPTGQKKRRRSNPRRR